MSFSNRLISLRKSRNITQKQICNAIGMSEPAYQRYEYGQRYPLVNCRVVSCMV